MKRAVNKYEVVSDHRTSGKKEVWWDVSVRGDCKSHPTLIEILIAAVREFPNIPFSKLKITTTMSFGRGIALEALDSDNEGSR